MMARSSTTSNQRPDTLMQDRPPPARQYLLQRTAGPYIGVITSFSCVTLARATPNLPASADLSHQLAGAQQMQLKRRGLRPAIAAADFWLLGRDPSSSTVEG